MASPVTPQFLLEGTAYALEQCGLLLRDANILYRAGSYASSVVLTAFAQEELGRSTILRDLRREVLSGMEYTLEEIQDRCDDHVTKQQAGMLSAVFTADRDSGLGKLLRTRMECHPQSEEWKQADAALTRIQETKTKRVPSDRHKSRMSALYVEPPTEHSWNRPSGKSAAFAHEFLQTAVTDYAGRYDQGYITSEESVLKHIDAELYAAFEGWRDRPVLQPPEWPGMVTPS
jgi:AbiV family abortive infection protein